MRFLLIIKSDAKAETGVMPDEQLLSAMGKYNESLLKAGVLLAGEGLKDSSQGTRVHIVNGKTTVKDGPFAEAKELVAGFWLISAVSKAEAIAWAKRVPGTEGEIEVRQLYEMEDFAVDAAEQPDGWREHEQRFRDAAPAPEQSAAPTKRKPGTTRFMVLLKGDKVTEAGTMPSQKLLTEMGALMQEVTQAGALLAGEGLQPTAKGARVVFAGDKRTVIDGPFVEAKELVAGYSIVQMATKQAAVEFARRQLQIHSDGAAIDTCSIEVRPIFELSDFAVDPAEKPDGWRQQEQAFRERTGQI